jgi:hypothetical protein
MSSLPSWWTNTRGAIEGVGSAIKGLPATFANRDETVSALGRHSVILGSLIGQLYRSKRDLAVVIEVQGRRVKR